MTARVLRCALVALVVAAGARAETAQSYADAIDRMRSSIAAGDVATARAEALRLRGVTIESAAGSFRADQTLLDAVIAAKGRDVWLQTQLETVARELRSATKTPMPAADRARLESIEQTQTAVDLPRGGDVFHDDLINASIMERISAATWKVLQWIGDRMVDIYEWFMRFFPDLKLKPQQTAGLRWIVASVVALILAAIGILAYVVIRRSRGKSGAPAVASQPISSSRDADPLSRGANEWEIFAAELAAAGRWREAIRAWYHAVLVTMYGAGIVSFRKGRTNWEYVAAVSPDFAWRPALIALTRTFEREWYGSAQSSEDAQNECGRNAREILAAIRSRREAA